MREIKFRGKSNGTGEWFFGNLYDKDNIGRTHITTTQKGCLEINPETVGQFTSLYDKNGKEIYEGDILICDTGNNKEMFIVEFQKVEWKFKKVRNGFSYTYSDIFCNSYSPDEISIIGNIHDNQERLKIKH